mmetsp:Transcript_2219/g.6468  ORF Transcript_2219/g.6468 Transcript_2219/m.6468 type:complete len:171 (-) Transcript_2219:1639-2151(-)
MSVNEVKLRKAEIEFEVRGTGQAGSRTFAIGDEDHTLGNCLRHVLIQNQKVAFAGYSVPHPSEPIVHLRVQTAKGSAKGSTKAGSVGGSSRRRRRAADDDEMDVDAEGDDRMTAVDALKEACRTLSDQCDFVLGAVEEALPEVKEDRERIETLALTGAHDDDDEEEEDDE